VSYLLAHLEISIKHIAADLGCGYSNLDKWIRHAEASRLSDEQRLVSPEQTRIDQPEKEIANLREVNEIIKKRTCTCV
jgi:transposase